jgi:hypothetical protein
MKISRRQLRRIIKEEKRKLLKEQATHAPGEAEGEFELAVDDYIMARVADGELDPSALHREMVAIIDEMLEDATLDGQIETERYVSEIPTVSWPAPNRKKT